MIQYCKDKHGNETWTLDGKFHRHDGPAYIEKDGTQHWYVANMHHRVDGPAIIFPKGSETWYQFGRRHRIDGPALTRYDGSRSWWLYDNIVQSAEEFQQISGCSDEHLTMLILKYGEIK